jgi:hypothetical protein
MTRRHRPVDRAASNDAADRAGGRTEQAVADQAVADERTRDTADDLAGRG